MIRIHRGARREQCGDCLYFVEGEHWRYEEPPHHPADGYCQRYPQTVSKNREQVCGEFRGNPSMARCASYAEDGEDAAWAALVEECRNRHEREAARDAARAAERAQRPPIWRWLIARFRCENTIAPPSNNAPTTPSADRDPGTGVRS